MSLAVGLVRSGSTLLCLPTMCLPLQTSTSPPASGDVAAAPPPLGMFIGTVPLCPTHTHVDSMDIFAVAFNNSS
ncbi:UNVERIFIED_CONTAM: hypothetical protein Sangu_2592800 [Sesamum angustifolium]|uniref:Secreted protein n=1 Tax=Sesamum angustifolium TaxID=2727405 RepID=A0AAW2J913_9LAMI